MASEESHPTGFPERQPGAVRLTFLYEGTNVQLISQQRVDMLPPPPEPRPIQEGQSGFWYELHDESGAVLYQRRVHNPIKFETTVYSKDPEVPLKEVPVEDPQGIFELVAPDINEAHTIVLFSSPLEPELAGNPASELARFVLDPGSQDEEESS